MSILCVWWVTFSEDQTQPPLAKLHIESTYIGFKICKFNWQRKSYFKQSSWARPKLVSVVYLYNNQEQDYIGETGIQYPRGFCYMGQAYPQNALECKQTNWQRKIRSFPFSNFSWKLFLKVFFLVSAVSLYSVWFRFVILGFSTCRHKLRMCSSLFVIRSCSPSFKDGFLSLYRYM